MEWELQVRCSGVFSWRSWHLSRNRIKKELSRKQQVQKLGFFQKWKESRDSWREQFRERVRTWDRQELGRNSGFHSTFIFIPMLLKEHSLIPLHIYYMNILFTVAGESVVYQLTSAFIGGYLDCWQLFIIIINMAVNVFMHF